MSSSTPMDASDRGPVNEPYRSAAVYPSLADPPSEALMTGQSTSTDCSISSSSISSSHLTPVDIDWIDQSEGHANSATLRRQDSSQFYQNHYLLPQPQRPSQLSHFPQPSPQHQMEEIHMHPGTTS